MPPIIISNESGSFTPHPEGPYSAICVDVHDLGKLEVVYPDGPKMQHKIDVYFFCGEYKDGDPSTPLMVRQRFTASLSETSRLRPFLRAWRGRDFTPEEERSFDVERLIGVGAYIQVSHRAANGKTFANIDSIMRLPAGQTPPEIPADFVRMYARPPRENAPAPTRSAAPSPRQAAPAPARSAPRQAPAAPVTYDDPPPPFPDDDLPF
jgi:hypothetical protein